MNVITVNGKEYKTAGINFNTVCELENRGITLADMSKKPNAFIRVYFAISANCLNEQAGEELEQHVINGGDFENIYTVIANEVQDSGFFRALTKKAEAITPTVQEKTIKKVSAK